MFNSLGIRHNKADHEVVNNKLGAMTDDEKEKWCDKTYDVFLLAELAINYINIKNDIKILKAEEK